MRVLVLGAGQVGRQICEFLTRESGVSLTILDNNNAYVISATEQLGISGVVGDATSPADLEKASIRSTDLLIAATSSDESNIIACYLARKLSDRTRIIARLRNPDYQSPMLRTNDGFIDIVINPEAEVARVARHLLSNKGVFFRSALLNDGVQIVGIKLGEDSNILNTPLRQLSGTFIGLKTIVVACRRHGHLGPMSPDDEMHAGDQVLSVVASDHLDRTMEIFGIDQERHSRLILIGAGRVGIEVARTIEKIRGTTQVRMIEADADRAQYAADRLDSTIVMHGDGLNSDMMDEANVDVADAILALTNDDKTNLLALTQAKRQNPSILTIGIVNDPWLALLDTQLGIDAVINPQVVTVSSIMPYTRAKYISNVQIIGNGEAEIVEITVQDDSPLAGKAIRNAKIPPGVIIGAVEKRGTIVDVNPDTRIDSGDRLVLFMMAESIGLTSRFLNPYATTG